MSVVIYKVSIECFVFEDGHVNYKSGEFRTHEEAVQEANEWLKETGKNYPKCESYLNYKGWYYAIASITPTKTYEDMTKSYDIKIICYDDSIHGAK